MQIVSINGKLCSQGEARIPVTDHGFLYGDGVFEGLRFYNRRILKPGAHLDRLVDSALALAIELPMSLDDMQTALKEVVTASPHEDGYIRLIVTRGEGPLGIDPRQCKTGNVVIISDQLSMVSDRVREQGAKLIIASTRRLAGDQLDSRIKSLNYLNQIMARIEANTAGADEAVVLNQQGFVAEGTADNIFIVKDASLMTPPVTDGALDGITRGIVLDIADKLSIPVKEHSLTVYDLYTADECFLTGTGAELIPVSEVAGRKLQILPDPVFKKIAAYFADELGKDALFH
ncbi:MAG: branched-chain-amino-acid transaminase [Pseudomonadales bacterium]|jgi:branched-chain amino acid aminotransferase|nr:branched-chain-amino-acid transaminase [Pseudomonadales bacterium]